MSESQLVPHGSLRTHTLTNKNTTALLSFVYVCVGCTVGAFSMDSCDLFRSVGVSPSPAASLFNVLFNVPL